MKRVVGYRPILNSRSLAGILGISEQYLKELTRKKKTRGPYARPIAGAGKGNTAKWSVDSFIRLTEVLKIKKIIDLHQETLKAYELPFDHKE